MTRLVVALLFAALLSGCAAAVIGGGVAVGAARDRRSFGTVLDDSNIELSAYNAVNQDKELALNNNVGIVVHNSVMLLVGEVRTAELRERAESLAGGLEGVRRIVNEISVEEPTGFGSATRDRWLTLRAKTALLDIVDIEDFDPSRVNITTQNSTVYLMGLVTVEEAERVVAITRGVPGVVQVVKVFEYIE
jgi:osmotically-inducible protein OsmY